MSLGNTKSSGNKGNNYPFQKAVIKLISSLVELLANPSVPQVPVFGIEQNIDDSVAYDVLVAPGAGLKNYVSSILVTNESVDTGTVVNILDGNTGDILWTGYAGASGGGWASSFPVQIVGTTNAPIQVQCVTAGALVHCSINGFVKQ